MQASIVETNQTAIPGGLIAALAARRLSDRGPALATDLRAFAGGARLDQLPQLASLFCLHSRAATDLVEGFVAAVAGGLRGEPDAALPLRHFSNDQFATLVLRRVGTALLSLQVVHRCATGLPAAATFSPVETHERLLAGAGQAILLDRAGADAQTEVCQTPITLQRGVIMARTGVRQTTAITRVDQPLLVLKLQRALVGCEPSRIIDLRNGQTVQQAAGKLADTRLELAATVLGQMERRDAAPRLAAAAVARDVHGAAVRWQALRAALALNSLTGFTALSTIAARGDDPLAKPARALREQLAETWPQLQECAPCL